MEFEQRSSSGSDTMCSPFGVFGESRHTAPGFTLHPVRGVVWAAFWGTLLAAGIVMAINYSRMGNKTAAWTTLLVAVLATMALFALIFAIPEDLNIPNAVLVVPQLLAVGATARALQGHQIREHAALGGNVASAWPAVGIGLLCLPLVFGGIVGSVFLLEPSMGNVIELGDDEVFYSGDATEDDARKLAGVLEEIGFFGSGGASVKIESTAGHFTVSFVLIDNAWEEPNTIEAFRTIGQELTESVFCVPLKIQLCDEYLTVKTSLTIQ